MALPKHKKSISKRNMRRSHQGLTLPQLSTCPQCNEYRLPHHACPHCGYYKGRRVLPQSES
ncbi:MAG: 50S ribosomal protein L32 [Desulfobacca sp.]|nr:50S ribosomal protein L32 [Desulfobacca sp.]